MGGWPRPLIGVNPEGISAQEEARNEILGLWALFWLCFCMNHKENQNSIFHGMVTGARQPDLLLMLLLILTVLYLSQWKYYQCMQHGQAKRKDFETLYHAWIEKSKNLQLFDKTDTNLKDVINLYNSILYWQKVNKLPQD